MTDVITITFNTSPNPWIQKHVNVSFSRKKLNPIISELIESCSDRNYNTFWKYGKHVDNVIEKYWNKDCGSIRPFLTVLLKILEEKIIDYNVWNDPSVAARRCLSLRISYTTPSLIDIESYKMMYGE